MQISLLKIKSQFVYSFIQAIRQFTTCAFQHDKGERPIQKYLHLSGKLLIPYRNVLSHRDEYLWDLVPPHTEAQSLAFIHDGFLADQSYNSI